MKKNVCNNFLCVWLVVVVVFWQTKRGLRQNMIICIYLYIIYISIERKTLYVKKLTPLFLNRSANTKKEEEKTKYTNTNTKKR